MNKKMLLANVVQQQALTFAPDAENFVPRSLFAFAVVVIVVSLCLRSGEFFLFYLANTVSWFHRSNVVHMSDILIPYLYWLLDWIGLKYIRLVSCMHLFT